MIINATFASTATSGEEQAVDTAINYLDSNFDVGQNFTINLTFGTASLASGTVASTSSANYKVTYTDIEQALYAKDTASGASAIQQAAAASLPTSDPTNGQGTFYASAAFLQSLGYNVTPPTDATIDLNTNLAYTYSSAGGTTGGVIAAYTYDAVGALEHEITEALGRVDDGGKANIGGDGDAADYTIFDMFRYRTASPSDTIQPAGTPAGNRNEPFDPNYNEFDQSYFSYDGKTVELPYNTPSAVLDGADVADWASSVSNDSFGEAVEGQDGLISQADMDEMQALGYTLVCYASGTRIRTARGDVAVEDLAVGDLALNASGAHRPIRWLGHRTIDCRAHPRSREVMPVRVRAHAFGQDRPARDLYLSPGHSVCVACLGDVLIPVGTLVNGATIVRHPVDTVTYWHVELDSHDILIAENLPAESFLDCGNRAGLVEQEGEFDRTKGPHTPADFCRPFYDKGVLVEAARARLAARAEAQGWRSTSDTDIHLIVDGARVEADIVDGVARFLFKAAAREVIIASQSFVPSDLADSLDHRRLGVSMNGIEIEDGLSLLRTWAAGDAALSGLFHPEEAASEAQHRFTTGRTALPPSLWAGCRGFVILRVGFDLAGASRWLPPLDVAPAAVVDLRVA